MQAVPWLRQLVADLSLQRPAFVSGSVHEEFVVDKRHWNRGFLSVLWFFLVNIIPLTVALHNHISSGE
jgi:hypothetical protein